MSHLTRREGNRNGDEVELLCCQHKGRSWSPGELWGWLVQTVVPLCTSRCPVTGCSLILQGSVALGEAAPFGRGWFLERDLTDSLQRPTLPAVVGMSATVLKRGSGWCTPHPPRWVSGSHYLHFHLQRTMFIKQWLEHLSKTKRRKEQHSLWKNTRRP